MSKPIRTALFGGTFNPLHNGHLTIARSVLEQGLADEVWMLITPCNPWKKDQVLLDDRLRYNMVRDAVKDIHGIEASDYEFNLPKPSYTANTLRHISADYPDREFIITIGADNWVKFDNWRESDFILSNYRIIVYPRSGFEIKDIPQGVTELNCPLMDVSSTDIRSKIQAGEPINEMVPVSVARTIADLKLYL
ncbi:MAG: nicotinate-nucleotide adenylyltransferase [Bacteroidaceae bacterium]|nr:nicotinate-nucleotide adenylyltransferase [Bacteroidaceae bacterium]